MNKNINFLKLPQNLFQNLNKNNINYVHFKSNSHLDDSLSGNTDFDILIDKKSFNKFQEIINIYGFKEVISQPGSKFSGILDFIGLDYESGKLIHLHTHLKILTGTKFIKEYHLYFDNFFLLKEYQTEYLSIKVPIPELELLLLLFRLGIKTSYKQIILLNFPENINEEINFLIKKIDLNKFKILNKKIISNSSHYYIIENIINKIKKNNISRNDLFKLKQTIIKILHKYKLSNYIFIKFLFYKYYSLFRAILYRLNFYTHYKKNIKKGGLFISIIGTDGSGKSTIIKKIQKDLLYKLNIQTFYLGTGDGSKSISLFLIQYILKLPKIIIKIKNVFIRKKKERKKQNIRNIKSKGYIYDTMASIYYYIISKDKTDKIKNILKHKSKGVICISDRFPQNQFCGINDGISCFSKNNIKTKGTISRYLFKKEKENYNFINKNLPDIVIKLKISAETAYNRKRYYDKSHNLENITEKINIIEKLIFKTDIREINTEEKLEKIIINIKKEIWKKL